MFVVRRATTWFFPIFSELGNCFLFKEILRTFGTPLVISLNNHSSQRLKFYHFLQRTQLEHGSITMCARLGLATPHTQSATHILLISPEVD
jgi:hypothetical protein